MTSIEIPILKSADSADLPYPAYATEFSSGVDLLAAVREPISLRRGSIVLIPTGIRVAIPQGLEGQVRPRSGLALRHGVALVNSPGTIDADYRGEIAVIMTVLKDEPFTIERGMRIAQLVFAPVTRIKFVEADELPPSDRGTGGFGHSGYR